MPGAAHMRCELHNIDLGRYDFETFTILLANHDDPASLRVTAYHEFLHHRLTLSTTFGQLMRRIRHERDEVGRDRRARTLKYLRDACKTVQEMQATYVSLTASDCREIRETLPPEYQDAFDRCAGLVEPEFDTGLLRRSYALAVARCAMMTRPGNEIIVEQNPKGRGVTLTPHPEDQMVRELLAGTRADLPDSMFPDRRLEIIEQRLASLPKGTVTQYLGNLGPSWLEALRNSDSTRELEQALGGNHRAAVDVTIEVHEVMMHILCALLEDALPGLSANYRTAVFVRQGVINQGLQGFLEHRRDDVEVIRDMAAQTVRVMDGPRPLLESIPAGREGIVRIGQSIEAAGTAYLYPSWRSSSRKAEVYYTSIKATPHPVMQCSPLTDTDIGQLFRWRMTEPWKKWITVVEWEDLRLLSQHALSPMLAAYTIAKECFAHLSGNPINYLFSFLKAGQRIKWTVVGIADTQNPGLATHLEAVFYAVEGYPNWLFHLSNPELTAAITWFTQVVADPAQFQYEPWDGGSTEFPADRIALLGGHPVLNLFYLIGEIPP